MTVDRPTESLAAGNVASFLAVAALAVAAGPAVAVVSPVVPPPAAQAVPVQPLRVDARVAAELDRSRIRVTSDVTFRVPASRTEVVWYLRPELELDEVLDGSGVPLVHERRRGSVAVEVPSLPADEDVTWTFRYSVLLSDRLETLGGYYGSSPWYPYLVYPEVEGEFARYLPVQGTITGELPRPWSLVSSGRLSVEEASEVRRFRWTLARPTPVIPLILGPLTMNRHEGETVEVLGFFQEESLPDSIHFLEFVDDALTFYSRTLGPFPASTYTLVEVGLPDGIRGLTLQGLTALSSADVHLESNFPFRILAHEIAHNWWSHYVDFARQADGWLREGLPTYSAMLFMERRYGEGMLARELARTRQVALAPENPEPLLRGFLMAESGDLYPLNYHKSAFVLHMLRRLVGLEEFVGLLRDLQAGGQGDVVDADLFRQLARARYGRDLDWFFSQWIEQAEIPSFRVRYSTERRRSRTVPAWQVQGTVEQRDARVEGPVTIRLRLDGAPPLDQRIWLEPGTTEFTLVAPSRVHELVFDPDGDLLYREVSVVRVGAPSR